MFLCCHCPLFPHWVFRNGWFSFTLNTYSFPNALKTRRKDQYFTSSTDLNSKFKNHRAREQTLWSMLSLQQRIAFALTGHIFSLGSFCPKHFSFGSFHYWLLLIIEASTSRLPGHLFQRQCPPHSWPSFLEHTIFLASFWTCIVTRIYFIQLLTCLLLAPPLECHTFVRGGTWLSLRVHLCVLGTINQTWHQGRRW